MVKKCKRRNCAFYNQEMDNNCEALCVVYENVYDCKFHKVKEGEDHDRKSTD